jgi:hypothetical protein
MAVRGVMGIWRYGRGSRARQSTLSAEQRAMGNQQADAGPDIRKRQQLDGAMRRLRPWAGGKRRQLEAVGHFGRASFSGAGGLNCGQPRVSLLLFTTKTSGLNAFQTVVSSPGRRKLAGVGAADTLRASPPRGDETFMNGFSCRRGSCSRRLLFCCRDVGSNSSITHYYSCYYLLLYHSSLPSP